MKLTDSHIEGLVKEIAGDNVVPLLRLLKNRKNVSEFKIAEKLKLTVNQVRNMLYKMNEHNLVTSTRKKDRKKGWYIYYWTFDNKRAKNLFVLLKKNKLDELKGKLNKEVDEAFFYCPNSCLKLMLNDALEAGYRCSECGELLLEEDRERRVEAIRKQINELEVELAGK